MGKCILKDREAINYLNSNLKAINSQNLGDVLQLGAAVFSENLNMISKDIQSKEGYARVDDFLSNVLYSFLEDPDNEGFITSETRMFMDDLLDNDASRKKFITKWAKQMSSAAASINIDAHVKPNPRIVNSYSDELEHYHRLQDETNGAESEEGTGYGEAEITPLGEYLKEQRQSDYRESVFDFQGYDVPLSPTVKSIGDFLNENFVGIKMKNNYRLEFQKMIRVIAMNEYMAAISMLTIDGIQPEPYAKAIIDKLNIIANSVPIAERFDEIRRGNGTIEERRAYYAVIALENFSTILHNEVELIVFDKNGNIITNPKLNNRKGFVDDSGAVSGIQSDAVTLALITNTPRLIPVKGTAGANVQYTIDSDFPWLTKDDINIASQFLSTFITNNMLKPEDVERTTDELMSKFLKVPSEEASDEEIILHSIALRFFGVNKYQIQDFTGAIEEYPPFTDVAQTIYARKKIKSIQVSIGGQFLNMAINSQNNGINNKARSQSGKKTSKKWYLLPSFASNLFSIGSDTKYSINPQTLKVIQLPDGSNSKYAIKLKLGKAQHEFTFKGNLSDSKPERGIEPTEETKLKIQQLLATGSGRSIILEMMKTLRFPTEMVDANFLTKYIAATSGNNVRSYVKLDYVIPNIVFMLAMNIPSNENRLRNIANVLPSEAVITSKYSYTLAADDYPTNPEYADGITLKYHPFQAMYPAVEMLDSVLTKLRGKGGTMIFRGLQAGYQYGMNVQSPNMQAAQNMARAQAYGLPSGEGIKNVRISPEMSGLIRGGVRKGDTVKQISTMTDTENLDSIINTVFLKTLFDSNGLKIAVATGSNTDSKRPFNVILEGQSRDQFLIGLNEDTLEKGIADAVDYHTRYYRKLSDKTLNNWREFLKFKGVSQNVIEDVTKSLSNLNSFLIKQQYRVEEIKRHLTGELDFVPYAGKFVAIKPEYIYFAEEIFARGKFQKAKEFLVDKFETFNKSFNQVAIYKEHLDSLAALLGKSSVTKNEARGIIGASYFWNSIIYRDMFRRALIGDILNFKGSIDRADSVKYFDRLPSGQIDSEMTIAQQKAELEKILIEEGLSNMMIDQAKRASGMNTGTVKVQKKRRKEAGSVLQHYDPDTGKGGIIALMFDEMPLKNRHALGARYEASIKDIHDGRQLGHPLFFLQYNNGMSDAFKSISGSALKTSLISNNGYGEYHKDSIQSGLTFENTRRSKKMSWLLKVMNTKVGFNEDEKGIQQPITLNLPEVKLIRGEAKVINGTSIPVEVRNMHDLYMHFGGTLGQNVYEGGSSWNYISDYILSGETLPDGTEVGFPPEASNAYVALTGTTSTVKMGNKNINAGKLYENEAHKDELVTTVFDPYNFGSILNAYEGIESSEGKEEARIKMFTQVLRSIKLGGHNIDEAEAVHTFKSYISDIGYRQVVDDRIETIIMELLIHEGSKDTSKLSPDLFMAAAEIRESIIASPTGMTEEHYDELIKIINDPEYKDQLDLLGTKIYIDRFATDVVLKHIDYNQQVNSAYKKGHLSVNSKQTSNAITAGFLSEVNKSTIKSTFKGSHTVIGPSQGVVNVFEVITANGISTVQTWDEYVKSHFGEFKSVGEKMARYLPYLTLETPFKKLFSDGSEGKPMSIGERAFKDLAKARKAGNKKITLDYIVEEIKADMLKSPDTYLLKVPDIDQERDLQYAGYIRLTVNEEGEFVNEVDPITGKHISIYDESNIPAYKVLNDLRKDRTSKLDAYNNGTLYTDKKLDLKSGYKLSMPISDDRYFSATTIAEAKAEAEANFRSLALNGTLVSLNGKIYTYQKGKFITYKQAYGAEYTDHTKYSKEEYWIYAQQEMNPASYEDYFNSTDVMSDINDDIYRAIVQYQQQEVQDLLYDELHVVHLFDDQGDVDEILHVLDVFKSLDEFDVYKENLKDGLYVIQDQLYSIEKGKEYLEDVDFELHTRSAWQFTPTEVIMTPHYKDVFFIDNSSSIIEFLGGVDYRGAGITRAEALAAYQVSVQSGDWSEYKDVARVEFSHLKKIFYDKMWEIYEDPADDRIPQQIFQHSITKKLTDSLDIQNFIKLLQTEVRLINGQYKTYPIFKNVLDKKYHTLTQILAEASVIIGKGKYDSNKWVQTQISRMYTQTQESVDQYILDGSENRALSFNAAHEVASTRIPSQDKQSYFAGRIVAYSFEAANTMLTPADTILISGADYDIDKLFNLIYDINGAGKLQFFEDIELNPGDFINEKGIIDTDKVNEYIAEQIEDRVSSELAAGVTNMGVFNTRISQYRNRLYSDITSMAHNHLVRNLMAIMRDPKNFKQATTLISVDTLNSLLERYHRKSKNFDPYDIISDLKLDVEGLSGSGMIGIVANALKVYSMVYNAGNKTQLKENQFSPKDYSSTYQADIKDKMMKALAVSNPELKKALVDNNKQGLFSLIINEFNGEYDEDGNPILAPVVYRSKGVADVDISKDLFHENYAKLHQFKKLKRRGGLQPHQEVAVILSLLKDGGFDKIGVDFKLNALRAKTQTWELFSELLSAATDNAKLLLLGKLQLDNVSISIVHTLLTLGINLDVAYKFLQQDEIQTTIKKVLKSNSVEGTWSSDRTSLRTQVIYNSKGYDKRTKNITSITRPFSRASKEYAKIAKTAFEQSFDSNSSKENLQVLGTEVEVELVNPFTQLLSIIDIQGTLQIIQKIGSITQGMSTEDSSGYLELTRIEYQIKKTMAGYSQEEDMDQAASKLVAEVQFDIDKFLTDSKYREDQIKLVGNTSRPGYNYLEVIYQNTDVFKDKQLQAKARNRLRMVQKVGVAAEKVAAKMKASGLLHYYEDENSWVDYINRVDEILVRDYFESNAAQFSEVTLPGVPGRVFNFADKQGTYDFLTHLPFFMEYLSERSRTDNPDTSTYPGNPFLASISLRPSSHSIHEENSPQFFDSKDVREYPVDRQNIMEEGYNNLDSSDQAIFELYSLLVNKSTKSIKTFEKFIDFANTAEFTAHKDRVLNTPGEFDKILERVIPLKLLLASRNGIKVVRTKNKGRRTKFGYTRFTKANPEKYENGVDLQQSQETGIIYASVSTFLPELKDTSNGWFPIEKYMGSSSIPYNLGGNPTGLKALLESGARPYKVTYEIPGTQSSETPSTGTGYILGAAKGGAFYHLLDESFDYIPDISKANSAAILTKHNPNLDIKGVYIGKKSLRDRVSTLSESQKTDLQINQDNIHYAINNSNNAIKNGMLNQSITKMVMSEGIVGTPPPPGRVIANISYRGAELQFKYAGTMHVRPNNGFSQSDLHNFGQGQSGAEEFHVYHVMVVKDPHISRMFSPDEMGVEAIDLSKMQSVLQGRANQIINGNTFFATVDTEGYIKIGDQKRVATQLKGNGQDHWFISGFEGKFETRQELITLLKARGYELPKDKFQEDKYLLNLFGTDASYKTDIVKVLQGQRRPIFLYTMIPYNKSYRSYTRAASLLDSAADLILPSTFDARIVGKLDVGISNIKRSVTNLTVGSHHLSLLYTGTSNLTEEEESDIISDISNDAKAATDSQTDVRNFTKPLVRSLVQAKSINFGINPSSVILKVPSIVNTLSTIKKNSGKFSVDTYQNVPTSDAKAHLTLLYYKKAMQSQLSNVPFYVYNESEKVFQKYDFNSGMFIEVFNGIPDIGNDPIISEFNTLDKNSPDLKIVGNLLKNRAYRESTYDLDSDIKNPADQHLIDINIDPTPSMVEVSMDTENGDSAYDQLAYLPNATIYRQAFPNETEEPSNTKFIKLNTDGAPVVEVGGILIPVSGSFGQFSPQGASKFRVKTYSKGNVVMIEETRPNLNGFGEDVVTYAIFPNDKIRRTQYGNFTGHARVKNLKGAIMSPEGKLIPISFDQAFITREEFIDRRDQNASERLQIFNIKQSARNKYIDEISGTYNNMVATSPAFKSYVSEIGGLRTLFNMLTSNFKDPRIYEDFSILRKPNPKTKLSLLDQFVSSYRDFLSDRAIGEEMEKELEKKVISNMGDITVNVSNKNPFIDGITPTKEAVLIFTDKTMRTDLAIQAITSHLADDHTIVKYAAKSWDVNGQFMGAQFANIFQERNGRLVYIEDDPDKKYSKNYVSKATYRMMGVLKQITRDNLETVYVQFPNMYQKIAKNSDITYADLGDLLINALDQLGTVPSNMVFSENLANYINNNSGLMNISKIRMNKKLYWDDRANLKNSVDISKWLPTRITMPSGKTLAQIVNIQKGRNMNERDLSLSAKPGSSVENMDPNVVLKNGYKAWLRSHVKVLYSLVKNVADKNKVIYIGPYQKELISLVDAANEIGLDYDIINQRTVNLGIVDVAQAGITYKVIDENKFIDSAINPTVGARVKTLIDDQVFVAEVIGNRDQLDIKTEEDFSFSNQLLFENLGIPAELAQELGKEGKTLVQIYKDPSIAIQTKTLESTENTNWGDVVQERIAKVPNVHLDSETQDVLNRGQANIIFDLKSGFGGNGTDSGGGDPLFNHIADVTGTALYTSGIKERETVISIIGTLIGTQFYGNDGRTTSYNRAFNSNDIKAYFDGTIKPILDNYIIANKLSVAIGSRPGVESEIISYLLGTGKYVWDENGNLSFKPESTLDLSKGEIVTVVSNNTPGFNHNNGLNRLNRVAAIPTAPIMISGDAGNSAWINDKVESLWSKGGKKLEYIYLPSESEFDTMNFFGEVQQLTPFIDDYSRNVLDTIEPISLDRNHNFIKKALSGILHKGNVDKKVNPDILARIIGEDGQLVVFDPTTGTYIPAHPMVKYAVARNKRVALMLLENNFQNEYNGNLIKSFVNDEIKFDVENKEFWYKYASNEFIAITKDEFDSISRASRNPSYFELMLYDITSSRDRFIDPYGRPEETAFYGKVQTQGINRFQSAMTNPQTEEPSPFYFTINTSRLINPGNIHSPKVDSSQNLYYIDMNQVELSLYKYSKKLYNYVKYGVDPRFKIGDSLIEIRKNKRFKTLEDYTIEPTNPKLLRRVIENTLLTDMYETLGFNINNVRGKELVANAVATLLEGKNITYYLSNHINSERSGSSLLQTLFNTTTGVQSLTNDSAGKITFAENVGEEGMLLEDPETNNGSRLFLTKGGALYRVDRKLKTFKLLKGKGLSLQDKANLPGEARPTQIGDVYTSINVEGTVLKEQVTIIRGYVTGDRIAESVKGNYYTFNNEEKYWETVILGRNNSEHVYVAAQKPQDMGNHTTQIIADGKLFMVDGATVTGGVNITTNDGWEFKYNPITQLYTLVSSGDNNMKKAREVRFQKEPITYTSNKGASLDKANVSYKVLSKIINSLSRTTGIKGEIYTTKEIKDIFGEGFSHTLGFTYGDRVIINIDLANIDTPVHEFGHFYFRHLRMTDQESFLKLKKLALESDTADIIRSIYPELEEGSDDQAEEILTSMLGLENEREALELGERGILRRILDTFRNWFNGLFGVNKKEYTLNFDTSLSDILTQIGTQLLYGPRSIMNDLRTMDKEILNNMMTKELTEKDAIKILKSRGFITESCA